jgi:hypothetical protein
LTDHWSGDELGRRRLVTVVLRLVLNRQGLLVHGEVVDAANRRQQRFAGWEGLVPAVRAWLEREPADGGGAPSTDPGASERKDRPCP